MTQGSNTENIKESRIAVGKRITAFYTQLGLKRRAFADSLAISYDKLLSYEQGRAEPGSTFFIALKERYPEADVVHLMTGIKGAEPVNQKRQVPLVNDIPAGQINFNFADDSIQGYLFSDNEKDKDLFALRVKGNSMYPEINTGDIIFLAPFRPFVSGKIYAVVTASSEATVKRVYREAGGFRLQPMNPEFESIVLPESEIIRLIRVVEVKRRYE